MHDKPTLAIVNKERNILSALSMAFEAEGFDVRTYSNGEDGLKGLLDHPADIGILGRSMPRMFGPEVFRRLRFTSTMPVIFLSSVGEDLADEVPGADDYLPGLISLRLIVTRVKAVLGRHYPGRYKSGWLDTGKPKTLVVDPNRLTCHWGGERVYLNMPEFLMLEAMIKVRTCTNFALMSAAYGVSCEMDRTCVDGHMRAVVRKIHTVDPAFDLIERVCGVAYRIKQGGLLCSGARRI